MLLIIIIATSAIFVDSVPWHFKLLPVILQMPASSPATAFPRSSLVRSSVAEPPQCQDLSMPLASLDCILFPQWAVGEAVPNPCLSAWFLRPLLVPPVFVSVLWEADTKMGFSMWECMKRKKSLWWKIATGSWRRLGEPLDPKWGREVWKHPRCPRSLREGQQSLQEVFQPNSAIKGVPCLPGTGFLSILGALGCWQGATCGRRGLGANSAIDFKEQWLRLLGNCVPCTWRSESYNFMVSHFHLYVTTHNAILELYTFPMLDSSFLGSWVFFIT